MISLQSENYKDLFVGSAFFSCGGGVPYEKSIALMSEPKHSVEVNILSFQEFAPDDWFCTVYAIGASGHSNKNYNSFLLAIENLEKYLGVKICGIIPGEVGSEVNAVWTADRKGLAVVDSDMVGGRAVPEEQMDVYGINNKSTGPAVIVNDKSDIIIVEKAHDLVIMEKVYRAFAIASGGYCYIASRPIQQKEAVGFMPSGTISRALTIGRCILGSKRERQIVHNLQCLCRSTLLAKGVISGIRAKDDFGFNSGSIYVQGSGLFNGSIFTLHYRNENVVLLRDSEIVCSVPDLISVIELKSLMPKANSYLTEGMEVLIFGTPALPLWKTAKGLALLGPRQFGFDHDYIPI